MPTSRPPQHGTSHRAVADTARTALLVALLLANVVALLVALVGTAPTAHAARSASQSLDIVVPKPANGTASGPVGASISVSGVGTPNQTYQLGYAPKSAACSSGMQNLSATATAGSDGTFSATFTWPASGTTRGANYYICAQDQAPLPSPLTPTIQSAEVFKPLTGDGETPNIVIQAITPPGPADVTPAPTPPDGSYYAASQVSIAGSNFLPGHSTLSAYVTVGSTFAASDPNTYRPLPVQGGGTTFTSQNNGVFQVVVTLPLQPRGQVYLHVVSTDSTKAFPPAMDANQQITLLPPQPTPTPATPTVSTTPSPSTTVGTTPGGTDTSTPNPSNVLAVIGLSGLSIILFVVGIILMTSAGAMPRTPR